MAASSSSSSGGSFKYDVFINFRGEDTRSSFVCHLNSALKQTALDTFIDSEELQKGDDLSKLFKAIQDSRLSIVVFSKNYASSTWCLKELVQILECMDRQSQIVVPVFYQVDPSHVRKLKKGFAKAFAKHESNSNLDKKELESWKSSLERATNLSGHDSTTYQDDIQLIKSIVEDIVRKVIRISPSSNTDGLIGMDTHMDKIDSLLKLGVDDCRIVGIWGMGGIGKSTIAKAVYEKISPEFEHKCFLDNVKEGFDTKNGAVQMFTDFLSAILNIKDPRTLDGGLNVMRKKLDKKKVLIVLDDVDRSDQIETLIGENPFSFGGGSRIIITTRDKKFLARFLVYKPELLATEKALELFRRHAFRTIKYSESYDEISRRAVEYAHGLPLALKVLGGLLDNKTVHEWKYELKMIKKISITKVDRKIGRVLLASYNGLGDLQKKIFLDIACFFRGRRKEDVMRFHESCGFFPQNGLRVLEERSLVTIDSFDRLEMHDLIQEMGRDIVDGESTKDPGRRSRLWYYKDVLQVLAQNTPAEEVEGIDLDFSKSNELFVNVEALASMKRLRIIEISPEDDPEHDWEQHPDESKQHVSGELKFLSNALRILCWRGCPLKSLPSDFQPKNLIKIDMYNSNIEQLWEGTKPLRNLVYMTLTHSRYLVRIPDLTEATNLKELNLVGCTSLLVVHPSTSALKSLVRLELQGCSSLVKFPNVSGNMKELTTLYLDRTAVTEMPSSINDLPALERLGLYDCRELRRLPSSINLKSLEYLDLSGCSKLEEFPKISDGMEKLSSLDLVETAIRELPPSIGNLKGLRYLSMKNCTSLVSLPDEICNLARLIDLVLNGCSKLEKLPDNFQNFESLGNFGLCNLEGSGIKTLPLGISRMKSLSCQGWEKLTAPFSSWPTCINPSTSAVLVDLDLSDCNLLEISDAIAHLSSLEILRLCRNKHLESLPAAMNRLPHLRELHLQGCESLKSIPELPSSIRYIKAKNCTSLETVSTPQLPCDKKGIRFSFLNCLKLVNTNPFKDIVEVAAATDNQGYRSNYLDFCYLMSLPGSDISNWFSHQCRGSSVSVQLPPDWSQGLAICAVSNLRGADYLTTLKSAFFCASFKENDDQQDNIYFPLFPIYHDMDGGREMPIESDHMFLGYLNSLNLRQWQNDRKYTKATFRIMTSDHPSIRHFWGVPNDSLSKKNDPVTWEEDCAWITSCGVRLFQNAPSSVDLVCNVENRETEMSSKRKRETLERDEETMGKECSGGPICCCFSLSGCTISLRKKQRERESEAEGVVGLESEKAYVSEEGGVLTLSL